MHLTYACRHRGACCSSRWPIPIERTRAAAVRDRFGDGWLGEVVGAPADVAGVLKVETDGHCVFHRRTAAGSSAAADAGRRCAIQGALGHAAIPSACQHFPRVCLLDGRGVFVTLSSYCPTAAELLFTETAPLTIVSGPDPVPGGTVEGLDAGDVLPPLLTAGVLMDDPGLTAWEDHLVSWLGGRRNPSGRWAPERVLAALDADARQLEAWRPAAVTLADAVSGLDTSPDSASEEPEWTIERKLRDVARDALPPDAAWLDDPPDLDATWHSIRLKWNASAAVINRYLAAHAFASWLTYQGAGVRSHVRGLRLVLAVVRAETVRAGQAKGDDVNDAALTRAIRQADLLLMHLVDRTELARGIAAIAR